ncbi:MAG: putative glycoside hydrolase [Methylococcales bacterium]|nr:putative glycoside hydrolase [Methylococcales bacterium]
MWTPHGFWVLVTDNRVFDGVVTRHLVAHSDIAVIHGFYEGFSNIVKRLHAARPGFRVLFYTWAGRKPLDGRTIGAVPTLDGMECPDHDHLLLKNTEDERIVVTTNGRPFILLDPRITAARDWLRDRISTVARDVGSDGVGLDSAIRTPRFLSRVVDPASYPPAFDLMIRSVSETTPITIFNGLTARPDQELLLAFAHGASIEFFGLNDRRNRKPTFASDILPYISAISRHADRMFLVFGRAPRNPQPYTTYDEDWLWQRYLYCAYLLAAGAHTRWKHHAGFLASPNSGRAGGLDVYADTLHDLGSARGGYTVEGGCYRRAFERSLVLVVPAEAPRPVKVPVNRPMFTLEGERVFAGQPVIVAPGEGQILLHRRPGPLPALIRQFDAGLDPLWRWSALREDFGASYLHLDETPAGEESEHDLALDLVRYRAPRGQVTLWYRTSYPAARVEIVVEVDDRDRLVRFTLVDGSLKIGSDQPRRRAQFRAVAPAISQFARLRVIGGGGPMIADGNWHTLVMDLEAACAASGRYEFRRALFARLLGSMDVRRLSLS